MICLLRGGSFSYQFQHKTGEKQGKFSHAHKHDAGPALQCVAADLGQGSSTLRTTRQDLQSLSGIDLEVERLILQFMPLKDIGEYLKLQDFLADTSSNRVGSIVIPCWITTAVRKN